MADPVPPGPLDALARAEWGRMLERMRATKILTAVDDAALYQYVRLWSETEGITRASADTRRRIRVLTASAKGLQGEELVRAMEAIARMTAALQRETQQLRLQRQALRAWLAEFGMTPSARTRVRAAVAEERNTKAPGRLLAFLGGKTDHQGGGKP